MIDRQVIFTSVSGTVGTIVGLLVLGAVGWFSWMAAIVVVITDAAVTIRFRPFRAFTVPRMAIASVGIETLNPSAFGGVGLRFMPPHDWALLFSAGPGFVLERNSHSTRYHVRSDRAEHIVTIRRERPEGSSAQP